MTTRLTFITGMALLFMGMGLFLSFTGRDGAIPARYFFISVGILAWFIGNRIVELDDRLRDLEGQGGAGRTPDPAPADPADPRPA